MKKYILFFAALIAATAVKAQAGYNYHEYGIGVGGSYIRGYTNLKTQYDHPAFNVNFVYNYNPYIPIEAEIQIGTLSGGGLNPTVDKDGRMYTNSYKALVFHGDVQLGAAIDYDESGFLYAMRNLYAGTGFGFIYNSNTVQRYSIYKPAPPDPDAYMFPGQNSSVNIMIPLRVGYEFKIFDSFSEPSFAISIGYVHNIVFGEGLDGYDDPTSKFKNNAVNQYRQITFGVKYFFGNVTSYTKLIKSYYR